MTGVATHLRLSSPDYRGFVQQRKAVAQRCPSAAAQQRREAALSNDPLDGLVRRRCLRTHMVMTLRSCVLRPLPPEANLPLAHPEITEDEVAEVRPVIGVETLSRIYVSANEPHVQQSRHRCVDGKALHQLTIV